MRKIFNIAATLIAFTFIGIGSYNMYLYYTETIMIQKEQAVLIDDFFMKLETGKKIDITVTLEEDKEETDEDVKEEIREEIKEPDLTIGVMSIPSLNVSAPIANGISRTIMKKYIGMYQTTDPLGTIGGNTGFSAHSSTRDTCTYCWFDALAKINYGDTISIYYGDGNYYEYQVIEIHTWQDPNSDYAYRKPYDTDKSWITLVTCSEGNSDFRHFVIAEKIN